MIVPLLQVFGGGLGSTETARAYATAALLARSKLAEVGAEEALEEGETTGAFEGYQWRRTISRSELTMAEADDRNQPDEPEDPRTRKQRRDSRLFGERDSERSSFGESRGGFGGRQSGRSSFGESRGGFGRSGQSAFPTGSSGRSDESRTGGGPRGKQSEDMIPYEVTVTVEWGARASGGTLSLSTLRLGRQTDGAETSRR
jgi:hypothetical protein